MSSIGKHALEIALSCRDELTRTDSTRVYSMLPHLHDDREPSYEVVSEKPWHRTFAYMLLTGAKLSTCAKEFKKSVSHLSQIRKQGWFKQITTELADMHFGGSVDGLLEGAASDAVIVLHELAIGSQQENTRVRAASELMKAYLGNKPVKRDPLPENPKQALDQINEELAILQREEGVLASQTLE